MSGHLNDLMGLTRSLRVRDTAWQLNHRDALLFSHDVDRGEHLHGRAFGRLLDVLEGLLRGQGLSSAQVVHPFSRLTGDYAWGNPVALNRAALKAKASDRMLHRRNAEMTPSAQDRLYARLLDRTTPRAIFTIGLPRELSKAARSRNIRVVEVLHGRGYHEVPWGWLERRGSELPTDVIAFDSESAATFKALQSRGVAIHYCRDPWNDYFLRTGIESIPPEWRPPPTLNAGADRVVLVTLQWGWSAGDAYSPEYEGVLDNGLLPSGLLDLVQSRREGFRWLVRLHPVHLRKWGYRWVREFLRDMERHNLSLEWRRASTLPLPTLLKVATHHVTMSSGATYDAAYMGVPTALLSPLLRQGEAEADYLRSIRDAGMANLLDHRSSLELETWLESARQVRWTQPGDPATWEQLIEEVMSA